MKIVDYLNSKDFVDAVGINKAPLYRKHFQDIIQKAGVEDAAVDDEDAISKIIKTFSWSWFNFAFGFFWAPYRGLKIALLAHLALYVYPFTVLFTLSLAKAAIVLGPTFGFDVQAPSFQPSDFVSKEIDDTILAFIIAIAAALIGAFGRSFFFVSLLDDARNPTPKLHHSLKYLAYSLCLFAGGIGLTLYCYFVLLAPNP